MKNLSVGAFLGYIGMGILIAGVAVFLAGHSLNFFQISFKDGQQAYAPLGLLLTEGGLFIWLVIFLTIAKSNMQKAIALIMTVVSLVGGMSTAIFDIYYETATGAAGFQLSIDEIKQMSLVVGALAIAHGLALIFELAGNHIFDAFEIATGKDLNRDGRIGDSRNQNKGSTTPDRMPEGDSGANRTDFRGTPRPKTNYSVSDLERAAGKSLSQIVGQYPEKKAFKGFAAEQFEYIDGENLHRLWTAADPTSAAVARLNGRR